MSAHLPHLKLKLLLLKVTLVSNGVLYYYWYLTIIFFFPSNQLFYSGIYGDDNYRTYFDHIVDKLSLFLYMCHKRINMMALTLRVSKFSNSLYNPHIWYHYATITFWIWIIFAVLEFPQPIMCYYSYCFQQVPIYFVFG